MIQSINSSLNMQKYDLSLGQKELWFIHSIGGAAQLAYNEPLVYSLKGFLSVSALKEAFSTIIAKHPILRTSFDKDQDGNIFQTVNESVKLDFTLIENSDHSQLSKIICDEINKIFDLKSAPLMRISVVKLNENEYFLIIVLHHIITDGTSFGILIDDLNTNYNRIISGESLVTEMSVLSYAKHVLAENQNFLSQEYQNNLNSIVESLKGYSELNFLTTMTMQEKLDIFSGNRAYFTLEKDLYLKMNVFCQTHRITIFHFLYSIYCVFLSQYTRSSDVLVGVPFANRNNEFERKMLGYFVNTLPIRIKLNKEETFLDLIATVKSQIFSCLSKQDVAFEHIASKLNLERKGAGQHPLIQTMFVWGSLEKLKLKFDGIKSHQMHNYFSKTSKFNISLFMLEDNKESVTSYFEYRDILFDQATIEQMIRGFVGLIKNVLNNPKSLLPSLSMIDDVEKYRMKENFFTSKLDRVVNTSLGSLFSESANHHRNLTGLIFGNNSYNYDTIELRSNQWASYIRHTYQRLYDTEMPRDTLIALCVDRNEDMIFGILGILKAGAAYVPIDPKYPQDRINYIINHCQASLLLTHKEHDGLKFEFKKSHIIYMDDELIATSVNFDSNPLNHRVDSKDLAYVLYTSGSTGQPKGVAVTHENVICLFESLKKQFELSSKDIWSLFHTFCFDISVWEIWGAFLFGGTLLVVPYEISRDPKKFYQLIESARVTVLTQTPSAFQMFINEDIRSNKKLSHLRYVSFVGESLKVSILRPWVEKYGTKSPRLANMYGITETTVYTNNKFIDEIDIQKGRDNIGWPLEEFSMCIMNENLDWCPVGVVGEICIGGRGLSRGYLYREDLTQEKFIADPYQSFLGLPKNSLLYRTGDLGRWMNDGSIEYLGRKDFQIKLRGFRIELGEIESALGSYENISHTAVLLKGEDESAYLAAYYTLKPSSEIQLPKLVAHLKSFLPEYMVPKTFTELSSFPMTLNGKIDRKKLSAHEDRIRLEDNKQNFKSALETEIATIWAEVLKAEIDKIGPLSNFFDLGGNSLLVIKMLTLVSAKIGRELLLSQFLTSPTVATLSKQAKGEATSRQSIDEFCNQLKNDIILNSIIQPLKSQNPHIYTPKIILITGVTGFLGAHMLFELLEKTNANIYCLIRATSSEEGLNKILKTLKKYKIENNKTYNRIFPIIGDLREIRLGLSDKDFDLLAKEVDSIYHVGALVHHVFDYDTLYKSNVQSVCELLKLATCHKNKAIHFVSTLAAQFISPLERLPSIDLDSNEAQLNINGYLTTKFVAEQLLKEAHNRGIAAHVYRPGNIVAGEKGIYEAENNHTLLRLKGMLQLQKAYVDSQEMVEMMPVDLLSSAIVKISGMPGKFAYSMNNSKTVSWIYYLQIAEEMGYSVNLISSEQEWSVILDDLDEDNALYKLSHVYKVRSDSSLQAKESKLIEPDYIIVTPSYKTMIQQQLFSLISNGFLENPLKVVKETID